MEQGAEGLNQWHVASHQFTEVSQAFPGHRVGAEGMEVGVVEGSRNRED